MFYISIPSISRIATAPKIVVDGIEEVRIVDLQF
jgi:hypothetical protein